MRPLEPLTDELRKVSSVQRKIGDLLLASDVAEFCRSGLDQRRAALDRDFFGNSSDLESEIGLDALVNGELQ